VGLGLADVAPPGVAGDPEAVAVDDPEEVPAGVVRVPLGAACFAQIATTTVVPDSSALPPSPDRSEK
jgi:hypothetical protein